MFSRLVVGVYKRLPRTVTSRLVRLLKPTFPVGVVAVIFNDDGQVLVLKHTYHSPAWRLPGGLMERGESPQQTAVREAKEEANCVIEPLAIVDAENLAYTFDVAVVARLIVQNPFVRNAEVSEYTWAGIDELPTIPKSQYAFIRRGANYLRAEIVQDGMNQS